MHREILVNARYLTHQGDSVLVIGHGTQGIVVEYNDGRVEILHRQAWNALRPVVDRRAKH
ncbi:MAG: hypothetical protein OEX00_02155 [Gammaproteobacteria bacterium]|nr:hypothetical protein [Gammaproteobacteria bacterium]MDH5691932.1 hypothetical protein [Gammaproteobacteria bacterium]